MDENEVAARLLDEHGAAVEAAGAPRWLQVRVAPTGRVQSVVRPEPEGWLGHNLPVGWEAAAVVATGRVHSIDPGHELPEAVARAQGGGLRMSCVVTRSGRVGWKARLPARPCVDPTRPGPVDPDEAHPLAQAPEEGLMLDSLRRAVGQPTSPPMIPTSDLFTLLWVEALMVAVEARNQRRWRATWQDLIGLHPVLPLEADTDPKEAEAILTAFGSWETWEDIRQRAIQLDAGELLPPAELAAWMDAGMFSRWVMAPLPRVDRALQMVKVFLTPDAYHRLRRLTKASSGVNHRTSVQ